MLCVDSRDRATLEAIIRATVRFGAEVRTDSFASYDWLTEAGYNHKRVNRSTGQFVAEDGSGTNSIEGLFMRTKKLTTSASPRTKTMGLTLPSSCGARRIWVAAPCRLARTSRGYLSVLGGKFGDEIPRKFFSENAATRLHSFRASVFFT